MPQWFTCNLRSLGRMLRGEVSEHSTIGSRIAQGAIWNTLGYVASKGASLAAFVIVARCIGKIAYGELALIQSTILLLVGIAGIGMATAVTKEVARTFRNSPDRAGGVICFGEISVLITSAVVVLAAILASEVIAREILHAPQITSSLRIAAPLVALTCVNSITVGALMGLEEYRRLAQTNAAVGIVGFPIIAGAAYWSDLAGVCLSLVAVSALTLVLNWIALRRALIRNAVARLHWHAGEGNWALVRDYCLPSMLGIVLTAGATWLSNSMLVENRGGVAQLGIISAATQLKQVPELLLGLVLSPMLPVLSEKYGDSRKAGFRKVVVGAYATSQAILLPPVLVVVACPEIILIVLGEDYSGEGRIVQALMLQTLFIGLFSPTGMILLASARMWLGVLINLIAATALVAACWVLVPMLAGVGFALAGAAAHLISTLFFIIYLHRWKPDIAPFQLLIGDAAVAIALYAICYAASGLLPLVASAFVGILAAVLILVRMSARYRHLGSAHYSEGEL